MYIKKVGEDVGQHLKKQHNRPRDNLSPVERQAFSYLRRQEDIIIKPADKGSAVVVLSKEDYINEAERQLSNTMFYCKLDKDTTATHAKEVKAVVQSTFTRGLLDRHSNEKSTEVQTLGTI